ncbi:MAG: tRNA glutamyl-Q(34) synthetase GluQRS [Alicyclobacillus sp.]|nr:tRNA glutamyl-Q(34) synthetase GluQRS [Alicyclobacillus sp.]
MSATPRGRFAPTPSGQLHLGNAATALLAWLQIRHLGGEFVLRIEDVDQPRCRPAWTTQLLQDLRWLGLDWDEGPDVGGPYGPYLQSERRHLYEGAIAKLMEAGRLYPCFCSRAALQAIASAPHGLASEGPVYPGTCRGLTPDDRDRLRNTKQPSLRFALPDKAVTIDDEVAGPQHFPPGAGGDFIVQRADGIVAYQLAVAVDDATMRISHVLRGADLLDSTPRQLLLLEALGLPAPRYAHVPLLCWPDGSRLSKRDKSLTLGVLRNGGVRPEQVVGLLAWLTGLTDQPIPLRPKDLIEGFDVRLIARGTAAVQLPSDWHNVVS